MSDHACLRRLGAACLLLAVFALRPSAAWAAGRPETVVLDVCGPMTVEPGLAEPWPGAKSVRPGEPILPTDQGFGCRFTLAGKPGSGGPVLIEARLTRPVASLGGEPAVDRWFVPTRRGEPAVAAYSLLPAGRLAPGTWTLELFAGDDRLAGQAFTVLAMVGDPAGPSSGEGGRREAAPPKAAAAQPEPVRAALAAPAAGPPAPPLASLVSPAKPEQGLFSAPIREGSPPSPQAPSAAGPDRSGPSPGVETPPTEPPVAPAEARPAPVVSSAITPATPAPATTASPDTVPAASASMATSTKVASFPAPLPATPAPAASAPAAASSGAMSAAAPAPATTTPLEASTPVASSEAVSPPGARPVPVPPPAKPAPAKKDVPRFAKPGASPPVPVAAPRGTPPVASSFALQTGLFTEPQNAEGQAARLRAKGMPACVAVEGEGGKRRYRVLAGRFGDPRAALGARGEVKAIVGNIPLVFRMEAGRLAGLRCH